MTSGSTDNNGDDSDSALGYLIGTGLALGVVHVLTGPDHLSALATLSANVGNHLDAAVLGIRWGIGHSSGLLLVGTILILLSQKGEDSVTMPDYASHIFESIVGIFMLLLGTYGIRRAWLKRPKTYYNAIIDGPVTTTGSPGKAGTAADGGIFRIDDYEKDDSSSSMEQGGAPSYHNQHHPAKGDDIEYGNNDKQASSSLELYLDGDDSPVQCIPPPISTGRLSLDGKQSESEGDDEDDYDHIMPGGIVSVLSDGSDFEEAVVVEQEYLQTVSPSRFRRWMNNITRRISTKTMAFLIGIVHGLAGPGGVLGVIPAVQLQDWKLATLYLGCFCFSSTITMGCFATMYGICSSKIATTTTTTGGTGGTSNTNNAEREFQIECFSALLSIIVGITWLTLLSLGKLEDVFP